MTQKLSQEDLTILLDLSRKGGQDALEAVQRVLQIAPFEARAAIAVHAAFEVFLNAAVLLDVLATRGKGAAANTPEGIASHAPIARRLAQAFACYPDLEAIDAGVRATLEGLNIITVGKD